MKAFGIENQLNIYKTFCYEKLTLVKISSVDISLYLKVVLCHLCILHGIIFGMYL